jgi:hypothetical protein
MSWYSPASNRAIVAVDIADFTHPSRTELHHRVMHDGLYQVLEQAFDEAGIDWATCDVEDRGDGAIILVPTDCPRLYLADRLTDRLLAGLVRYNKVHTEAASIQLRVALHAGDVYLGRNGKVSPAINLLARLLDAEPAKRSLRESRCLLAVIASDAFFRDTIADDPVAGPSFQRIPVVVKRTQTTAWLRLFGPNERAVRETYVLDLLPDTELARLRDLLVGVDVPQLPVLVSRAVGSGMPETGLPGNVWETVGYLLDRNAGPSGFPPVLYFVELLAGRLDPVRARGLRAWNDTQAQRLRLDEALRELRAAQTGPPHDDLLLYLMILIEHDGLDPDRFVISHWRQDEPGVWPPARGETREADFVDLEREIDRLVVSAEVAWSGYRGDVALEFVLPRALLNLPVDRWHKERDSLDPVPLSVDYPIVVRSLERMRATHWHRNWHKRWAALVEAPASAGILFAGAGAGAADEPYGVNVDLADPRMVAMVLSEAPAPLAAAGDALSAALRSGLPVVLWTRADCAVEAIRDLISRLTEYGGLGDLPARIRAARLRTLAGQIDPEYDPVIIENLVLLWDDPRRSVILDRPRPADVKGDTANEREEAS